MKIKIMIFAACAAALLTVPTPAHAAGCDAELIARIIWAEARGECRDGKLLVAQTVLDRVEAGRWGDDIQTVARRRHQFVIFCGNPSTTRCGINRPRLWYDILEIAQSAINGERYTEYYKILFFRSRVSHDRDWWAPFVFRVGAHAFYGYRRQERRQTPCKEIEDTLNMPISSEGFGQ